jgi:electron transfer flavoprotein alpha subunit
VETAADGATEVSLETVTFARSLAERTGGPVHALVVGALPEKLADELGAYGVAEVHHAVGDAFSAYSGAAWAAAVDAVRGDAVAVLAPGTPRGMEVLAHLAARLDVAMAANVVAIGATEPLVVTRQVQGGAVLEEMQLPEQPAVLTVAGHAVEASPAATAVEAVVREHSPEVAAADLLARVVSTEPAGPDESGALTSARVVVGAGRGAGSADGFDGVVELAELLDGALGVSRVVTSLGWRPHHEQIGQTGSRISPEVYIPCGISGAIQHWAGCSSSKTIVAINTDENAPMVTKATYAVIGDMAEVVPAISAEIRRRRS